RRLDLGGLTLGRGLLHGPLDADARAGRQMLDLGLVVGKRCLGEDLDVAKTRAVVEFEEAEPPLAIAARANPARENDVFADGFLAASLGHGCPHHRILLTYSQSWRHRRHGDYSGAPTPG